MRVVEDQPWVALNREEIAAENKGSEVAQELAYARERAEVAVARADLLIRERAGTEGELARVRGELERLRAIVAPRESDHHGPSLYDLRQSRNGS
jgi:phage terminase Nu1 subunit (DNA packaging protein)